MSGQECLFRSKTSWIRREELRNMSEVEKKYFKGVVKEESASLVDTFSSADSEYFIDWYYII